MLILSVASKRAVLPILTALLLSACSPSIEETPAYQAACQGAPLRTPEKRNQAQEDGYTINRQFDCIDKASFAAVEEQKARWIAANTPEAKARRAAEFAAQRERDRAERAQRDTEAAAHQQPEELPPIVLPSVDVNTATEADIAGVISISPNTAAQVIAERNKRPFRDWTDLVSRVLGLSQAQPAAFASICGLNVNGESLEGAAPDPVVAAYIQKQYAQNQR